MADLNQIVRMCVCAVVILACVRIIAGSKIFLPDAKPSIEDNSYVADVQVHQYFEAALGFCSELFDKCFGLIGNEAMAITQ